MDLDEGQQPGHSHLLSQVWIWPFSLSFNSLSLLALWLSSFAEQIYFLTLLYEMLPASFLWTIKAIKQPLSWKFTLVSRKTSLMSLQRLRREKPGVWVCNLFLWWRQAICELMLSYRFRIYLIDSVHYNTLQMYYGKWQGMMAVGEQGIQITTAIYYEEMSVTP